LTGVNDLLDDWWEFSIDFRELIVYTLFLLVYSATIFGPTSSGGSRAETR
jgi:hypothetical protein